MATQIHRVSGTAPQNLVTALGLTNGTRYIMQVITGGVIRYGQFTSAPPSAFEGHLLGYRELIGFEADSSEGFYVEGD